MTEAEWLASDDPQAMLECVRGDLHQCVGASDRKLRLFACAVSRTDLQQDLLSSHLEAIDSVERLADGLLTLLEFKEVVRRQASHTITRTDTSPADMVSFLLTDATFCDRSAEQHIAALLRDIVGNPFRPVVLPIAPVDTGLGVEFGGRWERCPWLTPTVVALAQAAYDERGRECTKCHGFGVVRDPIPYADRSRCEQCHGTGRIDDGTLDTDRLAILGDALEEAGCTEESLLRHLRGDDYRCKYCGQLVNHWFSHGHGKEWFNCPDCRVSLPCDEYCLPRGPHVRGCWAIDCVLGKE